MEPPGSAPWRGHGEGAGGISGPGPEGIAAGWGCAGVAEIV